MVLEYILGAVLLLLGNALFVAAEFALVGARRTRIEELVRAGGHLAGRVKHLQAHLNEYLSTCQVGITVASLGLGWIGERTFADLFEAVFVWAGWQGALAQVSAHAAAVAAAFLLVTCLHVILGELVPKAIAIMYPETSALTIAVPLSVAHRLFYPLTWVLNESSLAVVRLLGIKPDALRHTAHSEEELALLLEESRKAGVLTADEWRMLDRVFHFHDVTVRELMVPRPDIVAVDLRAGGAELLRVAQESGYSRLPVFEGSLDRIKGIVYVKDTYYTLQHPQLIKLVDLLREAPEVPETYKAAQLLKDFQRRHVHMAIVVDEFGVTTGLVTLEDLVEEIVGEIRDEHDQEPEEFERRADGTVLVEARVDLYRFKEAFPGVELPEGEYNTVAGLVTRLAGRLPREEESFRLGDLTLRIVKREGRRVRKVAVRRATPGETLPPPPPAASGPDTPVRPGST